MKTSATIRIMAGLVLLAFTAAALQAQSGDGSYTNLTVSDSTSLATLDISGTNTTFGTWGAGQALTLNLPSGSGTGTQQINFMASGTSTAWQWWNYNSTAPVLALDSANRLNLYSTSSSGTPAMVLDPTAGTITINGQTIGGGSGIWTTAGSNVLFNSSGNVGIGTSDPSCVLDIDGVSRVMAATEPDFGFPSTGAGVETFYLPGQFGVIQAYDRDANSGNGSYVSMAFAGYTCSFYSGQATLAMYIDENGNVGINTGSNTPAAMLDVEGDGRFIGPVHLEPQGDLDMGVFTYDPDAGDGGGSDDAVSGGRFGGGGTIFGGGGSSGGSGTTSSGT